MESGALVVRCRYLRPGSGLLQLSAARAGALKVSARATSRTGFVVFVVARMAFS